MERIVIARTARGWIAIAIGLGRIESFLWVSVSMDIRTQARTIRLVSLAWAAVQIATLRIAWPWVDRR